MKKLLIFIAICVFGYYAYNADALYGQYLFKQLCKSEGGARFYKRVEKGQGWSQDAVVTSYGMKHLELTKDTNRGFIRFKDESGKEFDARLKAIPPYGSSFDVINSPEYTLIEPANLSVPVRYTKKNVRENFNPDPRFLKLAKFSKNQTQVVDLKSNEVVASYTIFSYAWTKPERVILNAPTRVTCHTHTADEINFNQDIYQKGK
jgi:hypothetical protein